MKQIRVVFIFTLFILVGGFLVFKPKSQSREEIVAQEITLPSPIPTPSPTPTPRPLTFAEMNELHGPCARVPTLMYHHIQDFETANSKKQQNLTVSPDTFQGHLEHLQARGYTTISMQELVNFFDSGTQLPTKPVIITFDDGYADFAEQALPLLNQFQAKATLFLATGLANNPDYLSWSTINSFPKSIILVGNHTWSHRNTQGSEEVVTQEIGTADTQLANQGLNSPKVFSYPYGLVGSISQKILQNHSYTLAFTTKPGSILCKGQRLALPRVRIGDSPLGGYGL